MSATGTYLIAVKRQLVTLIDAQVSVPVTYGAPQYASDLTASDGQLSSIWLTVPGLAATATKSIPYLVAGAKPTREDVRFDMVVQAISRSGDQAAADDQARALMVEVESVMAGTPAIALTDPNPLACQIVEWQQITLDPRANARGCRFNLTVAYEADIDAPT